MARSAASFYMAGWATACLVAGLILISRGRASIVARPDYWGFLLAPWKVVTCGVATAGITLVAPYTGDPTWDHADALFMSVLAFTTAPWVVGTLYGLAVGRSAWTDAYAATCVGLFSASWSYDIYLFARDGEYPVTWLANLLASSVLYLCAGIFWSLDWRPGTGMVFAFTQPDWPRPSAAGVFRRIALPAGLLMGLVSAMILYLLWRAWFP